MPKEDKKTNDALHPFEDLDVLNYYSKAAVILEKFLKGREIATKTLLKNFFFLKRGSNTSPLFIQDLRCVTPGMIRIRAGNGLDDVRDKLNEKQILVWHYFVPRKMIHFFYATNGEKPGKPIDRIFIDIDRKNFSSEKALAVARALVEEIKNDEEFNKLLKFNIFLMWTGSSFHVYLLLKNKMNLAFYNKYLSYGEKKEDSFIMKWAENISKKTGINVKAGHEKEKNAIILDSSNTPSGKLARCPFSLHVSGYNEYDGVAVPLSEKDLNDANLVEKLKKIKPDDVLENLRVYKKLL
jgi:hypothetical protein